MSDSPTPNPSRSLDPETLSSAAATRYRVLFHDLHRHLVAVEMTVPAPDGPTLDVLMPIWTPGSYLVREYSRHVHHVSVSALALDQDEAESGAAPLPATKISKNGWRIQLQGVGPDTPIRIRYIVYAFEMTVRTSYVDVDGAFLSPAGLFMWADGKAHLPHLVEIVLPDGWRRISTGLRSVPGADNQFVSVDFDELIDSPLLIGNHRVQEFNLGGVSHQLALSGISDRSPESLLPDVERIVASVVQMFGKIPYERYVFMVHLTDRGYGGLEHKNSCALLLSRYALTKEKEYRDRWLALVSHEYFHVYNVKRIRPRAFSNFDYTQEIYTRLLWVAEGITSYYDDYMVQRAGLISPRDLLAVYGKQIARLMRAPGRRVQTLEESSFDAWIKFYRADEESENSTVSYYLKGGLVTWILDLEIRRCTANQRSMDDVMRRLFHDYQGDDYRGLERTYLQEVVEDVAGCSMQQLFDDYVYGTAEIDFAQHLRPFGLRVIPGWKRGSDGGPPTGGQVGIDVREEPGKAIVSRVRSSTPAAEAGLYVGDEIIAVDGHRAWTETGLRERLVEREVGQKVRFSLARRGILREVELVLAPWPPDQYEVSLVENPSTEQLERLRAWLGDDLSSLEV
jgi:predicted metalloprotease with PDZ domain